MRAWLLTMHVVAAARSHAMQWVIAANHHAVSWPRSHAYAGVGSSGGTASSSLRRMPATSAGSMATLLLSSPSARIA